MKYVACVVVLAFVGVRWAGVWCQECHMSDMPSECKCMRFLNIVNGVECSCFPEQDLILSNLSSLPSVVLQLLVTNCSGSVVVEEKAFQGVNHLKNITFHSLSSLTLQSHSLDIKFSTTKNIDLTFDSISALAFKENAVTMEVQSTRSNASICVRNSTITELGAMAINASLSELQMQRVTLTKSPASKAINLGSKGAKVYLDRINITRDGLKAEWMVGNVTELSIVNSTFNLLPRAFSGVNILSSGASITLKDNHIGYTESNQGSTTAANIYSLPPEALDLNLPDGEVSITAENNKVRCNCGDLKWLQEPMTELKRKVKESLECVSQSGNVMSGLADCSPGQAPHHPSPTFPVLLVGILLLLLTLFPI